MDDLAPQSDEVARTWGDRGFICELETDPPGTVRRDDVGDTDEVVVVLKGDIEVEFGGHIVHPRQGEEVVIPAWAPHTIRNVGNEPSCWLHGTEGDLAQTD